MHITYTPHLKMYKLSLSCGSTQGLMHQNHENVQVGAGVLALMAQTGIYFSVLAHFSEIDKLRSIRFIV